MRWFWYLKCIVLSEMWPIHIVIVPVAYFKSINVYLIFNFNNSIFPVYWVGACKLIRKHCITFLTAYICIYWKDTDSRVAYEITRENFAILPHQTSRLSIISQFQVNNKNNKLIPNIFTWLNHLSVLNEINVLFMFNILCSVNV